MRETVLAVVLGASPSQNRTAVSAVERFYEALSPGRRKRLKVNWVISGRDIPMPEMHIPSVSLYSDELEHGDLRPDLWLALDPDALPPLAREEGVVLTAVSARKPGVWNGIINLPVHHAESVPELAEALSWVYDDPGLKEMIRRRRAGKRSNSVSLS